MLGGPDKGEFVGRRAELAVFDAAIASARSGLPVVLLVRGDAGVGKSTLVREAARRSGIRLFVAGCAPISGEVVPLAPVAAFVRQIGRAVGPNDVPAASASAMGWLQATGGAGSPGGLMAALLGAIEELTSDEAAMLAFEDLHWSDSSTCDVFEFLARNLIDERVVLVGTYRTDGARAAQDRVRRMAGLATLPSVRRRCGPPSMRWSAPSPTSNSRSTRPEHVRKSLT